MSQIEDLANSQRRELERNNNRVMMAMASDLQPSLDYLNQQIEEIQAEVEALKAEGKEPGPSLIYKNNRAQKMRTQLEELLREYHAKNAGIIEGMRESAIKAGVGDQQALIESGTGSYSKVPRKALEALSAQLASDTPVRASLELYAQDSITEALDSMKKGLTLGWGSQRLAREMNSVVGGNLTKAMTIARTEVNRAYREASHITRLENASLLDGWYWLSSLRKDSCPACLLQHGTLHPLEERLSDHPNGSCTTIPAISGVANPITPTGVEIFNQMSESEKKEKLGQALYEAYSSNPKLTPLDLITTRQSDVWGQTHSTISAKALRDKSKPEEPELEDILGEPDLTNADWSQVTLRAFGNTKNQTYLADIPGHGEFIIKKMHQKAIDRERSVSALAKLIGLDNVPGSTQVNLNGHPHLAVKRVKPAKDLTDVDPPDLHRVIRVMDSKTHTKSWLLDYLSQNADRTHGNVLISNGKIYLIDNEVTFGEGIFEDPLRIDYSNVLTTRFREGEGGINRKALQEVLEHEQAFQNAGMNTRGWDPDHHNQRVKALKKLLDENPEDEIDYRKFQKIVGDKVPINEVAYGPIEGETAAEAKRRRAKERREARKVGAGGNKKPSVPGKVEPKPQPTTQQKETPEEAKKRRARERREARKATITTPPTQPVVEPVIPTKETPEEAKKRRAKERREARKARATEVLGTQNVVKDPVKRNPVQEKKEVPNIREVAEYIQSAPRGNTPGLRAMKFIMEDFREEIEEIADVHEVLRDAQKKYSEALKDEEPDAVWRVNMAFLDLKRSYEDLALGLSFSSRRVINTFIRKQDPDRIKLGDYNISEEHGPWVEHVKDLLSMFKPGLLTGKHKNSPWDSSVSPLKIRMELRRSYYRGADNLAVLPMDYQKNHASVTWHELGHWAEKAGNPAIYETCMEFYRRRTKDEALRPLNSLIVKGYGDHEVTRPDDFLNPYMGRKYPDKATEIFSMGLEKIKENPIAFMLADPDYFELMINILEGHFDN